MLEYNNNNIVTHHRGVILLLSLLFLIVDGCHGFVVPPTPLSPQQAKQQQQQQLDRQDGMKVIRETTWSPSRKMPFRHASLQQRPLTQTKPSSFSTFRGRKQRDRISWSSFFSKQNNNDPSRLLTVASTSQEDVDTFKPNKLDSVLSTLTSAFPLFVLAAAILGLVRPSTLLWTNRGTLISWMLASVMCATGLTLEKKDFTQVLKQDWGAIPAGVLCQFGIMPLTAFLVGRSMLLNSVPHGPYLFLGLCLVGCSPGGTASNLVSLIAKADVALSVLLTSCSTILASVVTPLLVKLSVGSAVAISGWKLCEATARVVLLPVIFGMFVNAKAPNLASRVSRFTPFASVLIVAMICGGVVSENASLFLGSKELIPLIVGSVLALHSVGFLAGYLIPRFGLKFSESSSRTISIETGMQNSALAVVLARSVGAPPVASLPGALSATAHSCLGSILAGYWRGRRQQLASQQNKDAVLLASEIQEKAAAALALGTAEVNPEVEDTQVVDVTAALFTADDEDMTIVAEAEEATVSSEVVEAPTALEVTEIAVEEKSTFVDNAPILKEDSNSPDVELNTEAADGLKGVGNVTVEEEMTESQKLLQQVKDSGPAGIISYAFWELGFWAVSVPVCIRGYRELTGHWPDLTDQEDLEKLGAEAFAFVNFARFAVPLRIGLALGTTPWIQENIVDQFLAKKEEDNSGSDD